MVLVLRYLPIMNAVVLTHVSDQQRGRATAIFSASLDVAYGSGAMIWGICRNACWV